MQLQPPTEKRTNQISIRLSDAELQRLDELVETLRKQWKRDDIDRIDVARSAIDAAWQEVCGSGASGRRAKRGARP
ncbi:MAG TPA: hypothetical protein DCQ33_11855 [Nitrospira sp.]|nr:hypothetical protein [Nitrospira sp.]